MNFLNLVASNDISKFISDTFLIMTKKEGKLLDVTNFSDDFAYFDSVLKFHKLPLKTRSVIGYTF